MDNIQIEVSGVELETIVVTLNKEEVKSIYEERKALRAEVEELKKKLAQEENNYKYAREARDKADKQIEEMNALFDALDIKAKTDHEESWARKDLSLVARFSIFLVSKS